MAKFTKRADGNKLTFTFGETVRTVDIDTLPQAVRDHAMRHGFLQVLGDSYAGSAAKAKETGADENAVAIALFDKRFGTLNEWTEGRTPGDGTAREPAIDIQILAEAIAAARKKPVEKVTAYLQGLREAKKHGEVRGWRDQADILPTYTKMLTKSGKVVGTKKDDSVFD